jgi:subtilisin family serine protease
MHRRTVTKYFTGLCAAGALAIVGCQTPSSSDPADEPQPGDAARIAGAADVARPASVPGEYIVVFRSGMSATSAATSVQAMRSAGATIKKTYSVIPGVAGRFSAAHIDALRKDPSVAYIEPNQYVSVGTIQNNPTYGLDRIDSRTGTNNQYDDFGFTGQGVHIFVVDTGLRTTHHEFTGRVGNGISTLDTSTSVEDCNGHGTHVASIAAGTRFGVAKRAIVHPVRALDCAGNGTTADVIEGLNFVATTATTFPAVVNMSIFGPQSNALNDAVQNLINVNIPVVVAAGNFTIDACLGSPASATNALTVGATAPGETRAGFSNIGPCIDIFAPGVGVQGAGIANDDATATFDGTSQAAPHVAGATALYLQRFPRTAALKVNGGVLGNATQGIVGDPQGAQNLFLFTNFLTPPQQSCFGRCGGQSADFSCACDNLCTQFGDCCTDKALFCK